MDDESRQSVIGTYDRAAPLYDQVGTKRFTYFARLLMEQLNLSAGTRVLDLATGRGALLFAAAERVGPSGYAIGIDLAPGMVAATRAEIERRGLAQASLLLMDANDPAFEPESFDLITCGFALTFLDYERLLPKLHDLLKPGGLFVAVQTYNPPDDTENTARWAWLFELTKAVFPPDFAPPPIWTAWRKLHTPEQAVAVLTQAGFASAWTEQHTATLYFRDADDWWAWEWSQGSRFWLEGMSPENRERFERESRAHLAQMQTPDGIPMLDGALFAFARK